MKPTTRSILFFDGNCGLCSRSVRFLIKKDRHLRLYFAPLQGITAQAILHADYRELLDTVVYRRVSSTGQAALLIRSDAALFALTDTGSRWRFLAKCLHLLPKQFRDWCYHCIASNRHRFKNNDACKLPSRVEHARILP